MLPIFEVGLNDPRVFGTQPEFRPPALNAHLLNHLIKEHGSARVKNDRNELFEQICTPSANENHFKGYSRREGSVNLA